MAIQDETMTSKKDRDQNLQKSAMLTSNTAYIVERGERAAAKRIDEILAKMQEEKQIAPIK